MTKLENQSLNNFPESLQEYFHKMSIGSEFNIIGSSSYKNYLYNNDFDLNEYYKSKETSTVLNKLYENFLNKFIEAEKDPNQFICDFKCGEYKTEPIRWNLQTMKKGYQIIDKHKFTFQDCLLMKSTMKLDEVIYNGTTFYDITNNYFFTLGKKSNYDTNDTKDSNILDNLKSDYIELVKEHKYFKALKRQSSIYQLKHKNQMSKELLQLFNSDDGMLYEVINDLNLVILLLDLKGKKPAIEMIINNLQNIKYFASKIIKFKIDFITNDIDKICNIKNIKSIIHLLEILSDKLSKILNKDVKKLL
jgi:hypothetical protein